MILNRRSLIGILGLVFAAPAIVKALSLMPIKAFVPTGYLLNDLGWQGKTADEIIADFNSLLMAAWEENDTSWEAGINKALKSQQIPLTS